MSHQSLSCAVAALTLSGAACQKEAPASASPTAPAAAASQVAVAGIRFTPPSSWTAEGPRPMRVATYQIPKAAGDQDEAECAVYFFGAGQGGDVQANLARWLGQFAGPPAKWDRMEKKDVSGVPVTEVDEAGTFLWSASPMSPDKTPKQGWRLLGAIVEAPGGTVFVKMTGPAATVAAAKAGFESLVGSIAK
jgi:hypothetical protein